MAVAATGFFDGVHLGHRQVIDQLCAVARERGEESVIVTFWPHPRSVLQQDADRLRLLTTLQEKKERCLACGVDRFEVLPFTREFSRLSAETFIRDYLVARFGVTALILGYDHRLGHDNFDTPEQMAEVVAHCGVTPIRVPAVAIGAGAVSSTQIRDALTAGEAFADVESVKAVSDVNSPVTGTVAKVNEELADAPEKMNETPYEAWFVMAEDISGTEDLMDAEAYEEFVKTEGAS